MPKDWEGVQAPIKQYLEEDIPQINIVKLLKKNHSFVCSLRALQMKLKSWGYHTYRTQENQETFLGKRKRTLAFPSEHRRVERRTGSSLPPETIDLRTPPPSSSDAQSNGSRPESLFPAGPPSGMSEASQAPIGLTLHEAVKMNDTTSIDRLLRSGADVHAYDHKGFRALHYAVSYNMDERVPCMLANQLLSFGANAAGVTRDWPNLSPLHFALWSTKLLKTLLQARVDVNVKTDDGDTPLHMALLPGNDYRDFPGNLSGPVEILLEAGSDPNIPNNVGTTPFHMALKAFRTRPADIPLTAFVEKGAFVNTEIHRIGFPFQDLAKDYISRCEEQNWPVMHDRGRWETALHFLLLRTSTTSQGEAFLISSKKLATHCLGRISKREFPPETLSTLTIEICRRITTELDHRKNLTDFTLPHPIPGFCSRSGHPFAECLSILIAGGLYREPFKRVSALPQSLSEYLDIILRKDPSTADCEAVLVLLAAGAYLFGAFLRSTVPRRILLAARGLSQSSERRKIVRILLVYWTSQVKSLTGAVYSFWTYYAGKYQSKKWEPPSSPEKIPNTVEIRQDNGSHSEIVNAQDMRALWEIMVGMMADECLEGSDLERTKEIIKDLRDMGFPLNLKWMNRLLDLV